MFLLLFVIVLYFHEGNQASYDHQESHYEVEEAGLQSLKANDWFDVFARVIAWNCGEEEMSEKLEIIPCLRSHYLVMSYG